MSNHAAQQEGIGRRQFLTATATVTAITAAARVFAGDREYGPLAQPARYPDPDLVVLDDMLTPWGRTSRRSYALAGATGLEPVEPLRFRDPYGHIPRS